MGFESKRALLEYLGKNPKDNKLVDRMMLRGEVYMEDGMFCLRETDADALRRENEQLKEKIKELEQSGLKFVSKAMGEKVLDHGEIEGLKEELHEAKVQWKYYEDLSESRRKLMEWVIHETYVVAKSKLWNKMEGEDEFRTAIVTAAKQKLNWNIN